MRIARKQVSLLPGLPDGEFKRFVLDGLHSIPPEHLVSLRGIYLRDPSDAKGGILGFYATITRNIHLYFADEKTLFHEVGHHVYHRILPVRERREFQLRCPLQRASCDIDRPYHLQHTEIFARAYALVAQEGSRESLSNDLMQFANAYAMRVQRD